MHDFGYYIFALAMIIVGGLVIKKVATCFLKTVIIIVLLVMLAGVYFVLF